MPLDGHSYLVSQGWKGKGTALREGAISRPITIAQKKNLAGLGKDRDEAFPFWDHLFSAAAKSIQIKYVSDDEEGSGSDSSSKPAVTLKRTSTGILSTRRPIDGTPAASGSTTPSADDQAAPESRLSLVAHAKREAARRGLYSRFFRGPVLGPEAIEAEEKRLAALVTEAFDKQGAGHIEKMTITEHIEVETEDHERMVVDLEVSKSLERKKRSHKSKKEEKEEADSESSEDEEERRARKKRRKEEKRRKAEEEESATASSKKDKKHKSKSKTKSKDATEASPTSLPPAVEEGATTSPKTSDKKDKKHKHKSKSKSKGNVEETTILPDTPAASSTAVAEPSTESLVPESLVPEKAKESKEERARRKEEKRRLRELRKAAKAAESESEPSTKVTADRHSSKSESKRDKLKVSKSSKDTDEVVIEGNAEAVDEPSRKKKRKRTDE